MIIESKVTKVHYIIWLRALLWLYNMLVSKKDYAAYTLRLWRVLAHGNSLLVRKYMLEMTGIVVLVLVFFTKDNGPSIFLPKRYKPIIWCSSSDAAQTNNDTKLHHLHMSS